MPGLLFISVSHIFGMNGVKCRISEVDVLPIHALLGEGDGLTEVINLSKAIEPVVPQRIHGLFDMCKNGAGSPDFGLSAGRREHLAQLQEAPVQHVDLGHICPAIYFMNAEKSLAVQ